MSDGTVSPRAREDELVGRYVRFCLGKVGAIDTRALRQELMMMRGQLAYAAQHLGLDAEYVATATERLVLK